MSAVLCLLRSGFPSRGAQWRTSDPRPCAARPCSAATSLSRPRVRGARVFFWEFGTILSATFHGTDEILDKATASDRCGRVTFLVGLSNKSFVGNYWWVCTTGLTLIMFPVRCKENILPIWLTMNQWTKSRFTHFVGLLLCATWLLQQSSTVEMAKAGMHNPSFHMDLDSRSKFKNHPKCRIWQVAGTFDLSDTQWLKLYGKKQSYKPFHNNTIISHTFFLRPDSATPDL